jgi:addiction module HigA family antidote
MEAISHPGSTVKDMIDALNMSIKSAAEKIEVTPLALSNIIHCRARITTDMALRLEKLTGRPAETLVYAQAAHDLYLRRTQKEAS